jgi:hypothetical protein
MKPAPTSPRPNAALIGNRLLGTPFKLDLDQGREIGRGGLCVTQSLGLILLTLHFLAGIVKTAIWGRATVAVKYIDKEQVAGEAELRVRTKLVLLIGMSDSETGSDSSRRSRWVTEFRIVDYR